VCADRIDKYPRDTRWPAGVKVWPRDRLDDAQRILQATPGVTALIYDQPCAADIRRKRKRAQAPQPTTRIYINERVCEGCGDCGAKSNCLSVHPVDTEFGRKTQIHQSSCNYDYSCLAGDCPAFVTVVPGLEPDPAANLTASLRSALSSIPPPVRVPDEATVYMVGIGGTGVVTASQILSTAAWLEGQASQCLDQTGLSQKGGPVVSHLKIRKHSGDLSSTVGSRQATVYLAFDVLSGAAETHLRHADPSHTVAVVSTSRTPTGRMVADTTVSFPQADDLTSRIDSVTRSAENIYLDAGRLSEGTLGTHMMANLILVGAAYQAGLLPVRDTAHRKGDRAETACRWRTTSWHSGWDATRSPHPESASATPGRIGETRPSPGELAPAARVIVEGVGAIGELLRLIRARVPELIAYQNDAYAREYADFVRRVVVAERRLGTGHEALSESVARYLFKLMAYKDEYEVARLCILSRFETSAEQTFGVGARISYQLHPPFLRALGLKKKIAAAAWWFGPLCRLLHRLRGLRGTALDVFGYAGLRRLERRLVEEYRLSVEHELGRLGPDTYQRAIDVARLPDLIRGYEDIKRRNVALYREAVRRHQSAAPACDGVLPRPEPSDVEEQRV
jgi:indolepyruvate ferredoxin oxidoreductase